MHESLATNNQQMSLSLVQKHIAHLTYIIKIISFGEHFAILLYCWTIEIMA